MPTKLTYVQSTGQLYQDNTLIASNLYSGGNCGKNPEGKNNPAMQNVSCIGPLPRGDYMFGEVIQHHPKLGPFVIPLIPHEDNEMFGRSAFRVHGDTTPAGNASEGCIIAPRSTRELIYSLPDVNLTVIDSR